jgi:hypothetical protein
MYLHNGIKLEQTTLINDVNYDISWFVRASPEQMTDLGVTYVEDPALPDSNLYTWVVNADGSITATALDPAQLAANLTKAQVAATLRIDLEVDKIYQDAVGNRVTEYQLARDQALNYQTAGYTGTVPVMVQHWAELNTQTTQWATDSILAQAAAWATAQLAIRDHRLTSKAEARLTTDRAALDVVMVLWNGFVTYIRGALGI